MGETPVNRNGVPMALGNGQGPRIRPAFKQRQRSGLNREIFAVQCWGRSRRSVFG